ncbi:MAG: alpha/beta hydrolase [Alphaproteobacteria bacterium]|nr:alpha/beta hydrolase [Alphaproteobacteria bacterium]
MRAALVVLAVGCSNGRVNDRFNVRSDGAVLPVVVHGNVASGTLVLFESGGPSGPGIAERDVGYLPFRDTLEPSVAIALYDRRGTGNATGDYGVDDQSMVQLLRDLDAVRAVLEDRYTPDRIVLMGHSFGGYSSALYQLDVASVDGWIGVAPAVLEGPDDLYVPYRRDFACRVAEGQRAAGEVDALWTDLEAFCAANPTLEPEWDTPQREELWTYLAQIEDRLEPWPAMDPLGLLAAVFASHYELIDSQLRPNLISDRIAADPGREDLLPELPTLDVPTLVVTGEFDGTVPTELGAAVASAVGGELAQIDGGGHYPMADDPERFGQVVLAFVDSL